jgi:calcium-dependent protein kinase
MLLLTVRLDLRRSEKAIANEKDKYPLIFIANQKELVLHASSLDSYHKWVAALRQCCILNNYRQTFINLKVLGKGSFAKVNIFRVILI